MRRLLLLVDKWVGHKRASKVAFDLNRIDGTPALPLLRPDNVSVRADEAMIELQLSADHDIELYFPAPGGVVERGWLELAADVLAHLTEIDNEVQRVSAELWAGKPYPSSYYEGELAYITLTGLGKAVLRYWVIGCNAEWDERFVCTGGSWVRIEQTELGAAGESGA
jgi:hypothetical protein